jgi:beta-galactosidase
VTTAPTRPTPRLDRQPGPAGSQPQPGWPRHLDQLAFGGDYNPEQWPEEVWVEDVRLMREIGINFVTVGVFSWALLEPEPGRYDFGWLDRVVDRLHGAGILVDLATPTAAPPAWFSRRYPASLPVTRTGQVLGIGARESFCPSSPDYRAAAGRLVQRMADRYAGHPALALWHVNNEYGAHVGPCYCPTSEAAFRRWLRSRYGDLDGLNQAWGTAFWGQRYGDWAEVTAPRLAPMPVNPAQQLDFLRFSNAEYLDCYRAERDLLRAATPDIPVTTNFMASNCKHMDYWTWAGEVDIVANDHYLRAEDADNHIDLAMTADLTRGLAGGAPWLLMEHSTSAVNWQPRNIAKAPGQLRRNSLAHVARGSDSALFFQWRSSRSGGEKFHSAMLPQAGTGSRVWREVRALGTDLAALAEIRGSRVQADVALVWDWPAWWALELEYRPSTDVDYLDRIRALYRTLWQANHTVDFVPPAGDLSRYRLVVVPSLYLTTAPAAANLRGYVEAGGHLLVSFFSGIVDEHDAVHPGPYPGALRDLLGLWIEEFHPLRRDEHVELTAAGAAGAANAAATTGTAGTANAAGTTGATGPAGAAGPAAGRADVWSEQVVPAGCETVLAFGTGPDAGHPALTRHRLGAGTAWYLATRPDPDTLAGILDRVTTAAGLATPAPAPPGVEIVRRCAGDTSWLFLINHGADPVTVPGSGRDLLTGQVHERAVPLPAAGVAVLREPA